MIRLSLYNILRIVILLTIAVLSYLIFRQITLISSSSDRSYSDYSYLALIGASIVVFLLKLTAGLLRGEKIQMIASIAFWLWVSGVFAFSITMHSMSTAAVALAYIFIIYLHDFLGRKMNHNPVYTFDSRRPKPLGRRF